MRRTTDLQHTLSPVRKSGFIPLFASILCLFAPRELQPSLCSTETASNSEGLFGALMAVDRCVLFVVCVFVAIVRCNSKGENADGGTTLTNPPGSPISVWVKERNGNSRFEVTVMKNTIDTLKVAIKARKSPELDWIAADEILVFLPNGPHATQRRCPPTNPAPYARRNTRISI